MRKLKKPENITKSTERRASMSSEFGDELQEIELDLREIKGNIKTLTKAIIELSKGRISSETSAMLRTIIREKKVGVSDFVADQLPPK